MSAAAAVIVVVYIVVVVVIARCPDDSRNREFCGCGEFHTLIPVIIASVQKAATICRCNRLKKNEREIKK